MISEMVCIVSVYSVTCLLAGPRRATGEGTKSDTHLSVNDLRPAIDDFAPSIREREWRSPFQMNSKDCWVIAFAQVVHTILDLHRWKGVNMALQARDVSLAL